MLIVTTESIVGKRIVDVKGMCVGSTIQSKHIGSDIGAGFRTLIGGEVGGYKDMMDKARKIATDRMIKEAVALGANAIVCVRYTTSAVMAGASEVVAYGTAVVVE